MKEQLYTIPLNDAFAADDECPFCYIEQKVEQDLLDFTLGSGSSYMESDIRDITDKAGFCRYHFQKMFQYGNTLGNAWILKTHFRKINQELDQEIKRFKPAKISFLDRMKKSKEVNNTMTAWTYAKQESCYICNQYKDTYARYMDTFFFMYKKDEAFRKRFEESKGFCLVHFGDLCQAACETLSDKQKEEFFPVLFGLMKENMERVGEDVSWLVEKFDYKNLDETYFLPAIYFSEFVVIVYVDIFFFIPVNSFGLFLVVAVCTHFIYQAYIRGKLKTPTWKFK